MHIFIKKIYDNINCNTFFHKMFYFTNSLVNAYFQKKLFAPPCFNLIYNSSAMNLEKKINNSTRSHTPFWNPGSVFGNMGQMANPGFQEGWVTVSGDSRCGGPVSPISEKDMLVIFVLHFLTGTLFWKYKEIVFAREKFYENVQYFHEHFHFTKTGTQN